MPLPMMIRLSRMEKFWGLGLLLILLSACQAGLNKPTEPGAQPEASPVKASLRLLALGDSYTAGEGVTLSESWPQQLAALLRQNGQTVSDLTVVARSGWTSDDLLAGLQEANPQGPYDLVVLLIGANDQFRGYSPESYRSNLSHLLSQAIHLAGGQAGQVVVLSIPDWSQAPAGALFDPREAADDVARFNAINRSLAQAAGAGYVDLSAIWQQEAPSSDQFIADGLHPNARQYAAWARLILPTALQALGAVAP